MRNPLRQNAVVHTGTAMDSTKAGLLLLLALALAPAPVFADWNATGPDGGDVSAFAATANMLYLGTKDGIYSSADGGANWSRLGDFPRMTWIFDIVVHPADPSILLASTGAMYRSTDAGMHWTLVSGALGKAVFHPLMPDHVLATSYGPSTQRSTDGGQTWIPVTLPGNVPLDSQDVAADPFQADAFYALTSSRVLYRTVDGGQTWTSYDNPPSYGYGAQLGPDPFDSNAVLWAQSDLDVATVVRLDRTTGERDWVLATDSMRAFIADPLVAGRFWASANYDQQLFESIDGGINWSTIGAIAATPLAADPSAVDLLYGNDNRGFARSLDAGRTWESRTHGVPLAKTRSISIRPDLTREILASGEGFGVALSTDTGQSWSIDSTLAGFEIGALARSPQDPLEVYAGGDHGLFHSLDGGRTWQKIVIESYPNGYPRDFARISIDRTDTRHLFAIFDYGQAVWSDDGGANWYAGVTDPPQYFDARLTAATYTGTGKVYAARFVSGENYALFRSESHGQPFVLATGDIFLTAFSVHPQSDNVLFALSKIEAGVAAWTAYRSYDSGDHWEERGVLTLDPVDNASGLQLRVDPCNPQTLYAAVGSTLAISTDQGMTWTREPLPLRSYVMNDLDARCSEGAVIVAAATEYAGAQVRMPALVDLVFSDGFEAN
jgi:photosystem II stability/assembly factor-like uncharacterized protein